MKAYYLIGGVTPVEQIVELFKDNDIQFDEFEAKDTSHSVVTFYKKDIDDFKQAKVWFDGVTKFLWATIWKAVDGGHTCVGCVDNEGDEFYDDEGRDYSEWEQEQEDT